MDDDVVVATYNVHRCRGLDGRRDPERIGAVVRELEADVVALQEAHYPTDAVDDEGEPVVLEALPEYRCIAAPTLREPGHHFGNAVLTRHEIRHVERLNLSRRWREPRVAIDVTLGIRGHEVRVIATHLGLGFRERRVQVSRLLDHLDRHPAPFVVLLGDFNDWLPGSPAVRRIERRLGRSPRIRSFPTFRPLFSLDRVWVHPGSSLKSVHAHRSALARRASDHLPIVARLIAPSP